MWPKCLTPLLLLALFLPAGARAAEVARTDCEGEALSAHCRIALVGEVKAGERLFLSHVYERDTIFFHGRSLGSTGDFLGHRLHAGFLPRVYSLSAIAGEQSPVLELEVRGGLLHPAGLPTGTEVRVIDDHYPVWRVIGPACGDLFRLAVLVVLALYALCFRERSEGADGWLFPRDEMRAFLGSLAVSLLLREEVAGFTVPLLWSAHLFLSVQRTTLLVFLWSATVLLLRGRFSDRSCIERTAPRTSPRALVWLAHAALLGSLAMGDRWPNTYLMLPALPLLLAQERVLRTLEWGRLFKRSGLAPLFFFLGLATIPSAVLASAVVAWSNPSANLGFLTGAAWALLLLAGNRTRSRQRAVEQSRELATACRLELREIADSTRRLQCLCDFIAEEWGAARVSVISVSADNGLVLNSAGPDAISEEGRALPRRLGPFIRRVCKQEQMLYAPVAEELGHDLQQQGLRHSSLAIPLRQDGAIRAVLCVMADEGQRIPPSEAAQLEMLVDSLCVELLSAVAQAVAERRHQHLLLIARDADPLAVENLDHWGHFREEGRSEARVVLGGDCVPGGPHVDALLRSPLLGRLASSHRAEIRAAWLALAAAFEFLPKDKRDDFWVISPREFRHPLFQRLGAMRVAALLAAALERQARLLGARPALAALGPTGVRLAFGRVALRRNDWHHAAVDLEADAFAQLLEMRRHARPGQILFAGDAQELADFESFLCQAQPLSGPAGGPIFSILQATADRKELRRFELLAAERARSGPRKSA